jgi:predicted nucleotidyltransferase
VDTRTGQLAEWLSTRLKSFPTVRAVAVFGSRARGDHRDRSDVDLAVLAPAAGPVAWADIVEAIEEAPTLLRIEIVRWEQAPESLQSEIERDGIVIYGTAPHAA